MAETLVAVTAAPGLRIEGLRLWRQLAGLTQGELARRVGVNQSMISELERGTRSPRLSTARQLLQILGAPSLEALFPPVPDARPGRSRRALPPRSSKG